MLVRVHCNGEMGGGEEGDHDEVVVGDHDEVVVRKVTMMRWW